MYMILSLLFLILQIFNFILLARVILSWLPNIDRSNPLVKLVYDITEPILQPIRQVLPQSSGVDFSPMVAFIAIYVLMMMLRAF